MISVSHTVYSILCMTAIVTSTTFPHPWRLWFCCSSYEVKQAEAFCDISEKYKWRQVIYMDSHKL